VGASAAGLGKRVAQKYVADAKEQRRESADIDPGTELGLAMAGYQLIYRRELGARDLRSARAGIDKLVALLGVAISPRERATSLAAIAEQGSPTRKPAENLSWRTWIEREGDEEARELPAVIDELLDEMAARAKAGGEAGEGS